MDIKESIMQSASAPVSLATEVKHFANEFTQHSYGQPILRQACVATLGTGLAIVKLCGVSGSHKQGLKAAENAGGKPWHRS